MSHERDISAIGSWARVDAPDPGRSHGTPTPWHCRDCAATGKGVMTQAAHWRETQHVTRFGKRPSIYAVYAFDQPDFKGGTMRLYHIHGGDHDRSTVTRERLRVLGIPLREAR